MKKFFICLYICLFPSAAFGCMVASSGPKYDHLIKIVKLVEKNKYQVSIPKDLDPFTSNPTATLVYSLKYGDNTYQYKYRYKKLNLKKLESRLVGTFTVKMKEHEKSYVSIHWLPVLSGLCGTNAKAFILGVE